MTSWLPACRRWDLIDVVERVLTKGVIFDTGEEDIDVLARDRNSLACFRIVIAGVDVFRIESEISWRYLRNDLS